MVIFPEETRDIDGHRWSLMDKTWKSAGEFSTSIYGIIIGCPSEM